MASQDHSKGAKEGAADTSTTTTSKTAGDDVWTPQVRRKFETKSKSEYLDPCQEAAARSIRCLHRNGGDKALCQDYFQAYRDCKKSWQEKRLEDKRKARQESGGWFS
ncbi:Mitochondrial copper homeostasis protein [Sporothrix eucalyptigena]|uniref:Cytochrome c oxidase-assembly factor COX23, mitochondrial n=1 Tax=Sporothrix eucalyptigena TaxID=1812306 RepID=A0ABP0CBS6_9PEZI